MTYKDDHLVKNEKRKRKKAALNLMKNKTGQKLKFNICWSLYVQYIPETARHSGNSYY